MAKKKNRRVVPFEELGGPGGFMEQADSPLSYALIGGAYIENALGSLLLTALIDCEKTNDLLNNPEGILSTASSRSAMCFCLGLIPESVYKNAKKIFDVRNRFAHSHTVIDFDDDAIRGHCQALTLPTVLDQRGERLDIKHTPHQLGSRAWADFVFAVFVTHMAIEAASKGVQKKNPEEYEIRCMVPDDVEGPVIFYSRDPSSSS